MKKLPAISLFLFISLQAEAQTLIDLNLRIYQDLETWENQGYIYQLPLFKPYSGVMLSALLKEAEEKGSQEVKEKVKQYRKRHLSSLDLPNLSFKQDSFATNKDYYGSWQGKIQERAMINNHLSLDAELQGQIIHSTIQSDSQLPKNVNPVVLPTGQELGLDYFIDKTLFYFQGNTIAVTGNYYLLIGIGNSSFIGQTGFSRTSFLDLDNDSLVISPYAYKTSHFSLIWRTASTTLTSLFMNLVASQWTGEGSYPNKYLNFSSLQWKIMPCVELVFYNTVIYGQRIAPEYFIPGLVMIHAQDSGNHDNVFMGGALRLFLPWNIKVTTNLYLDDFEIMKFIFGRFNTRFKAAMDVHAQWTPENSFLERLSLGYSAVMPYTYTHNPEFIDDPTNIRMKNLDPNINYSDATHQGAPIGTILKPNSDRLRLNVKFIAPQNFRISTGVTYLRHGNASEGANHNQYPYLDKIVEEGSIFDSGYNNNSPYGNLFEKVDFLSQKVIEHSLQASLGIQWPFEFPCWAIIPEAKFTGEWYWNRKLIQGNSGFIPYMHFSVEWLF